MIAISMGDANGVGPEILLRAFQQKSLPDDFLVIGDYSALRKCSELLDLQVPLHVVDDSGGHRNDAVNLRDMRLLNARDISPGRISEKIGRAALRYIKECALLILKGSARAMVTLPVHKEAVRLSKPDFDGHTGYLAAMCGTENYAMMLYTEKLIVTHVTTHISLREVPARITKERVFEVIRLTHDAVKKLRPRARIAVAGLNPHAGEGGAFGREEVEEIMPAVRLAQNEGYEVSGPLAPDTVFYHAAHSRYDAVVCMYHDQGHIPIKLLDFEGGVNVTLGLPFVRTSVDHGTAYDIAYKGVASLTSFTNACDLARVLRA